MQKMQVPPLGREDPLEKGMATHTSYFGLGNPVGRGTWQVTVHGVAQGSDRIKRHIVLTIVQT